MPIYSVRINAVHDQGAEVTDTPEMMLTTDCHFPPPPTLAEELPEQYRQHFVRLEERDDGVYLVRPMPMQMAAETDGYTPNPTTTMLNTGVKLENPDDGAELARIVQGDVAHDACPSFKIDDLIGELEAAQECAGNLHRFAPGIQLPLGSVEESVKELQRAASLGLRPALLPDVFPARHWLDPEWEPLWEALAGLDVPVTMHVTDARAGLPWSMATAFAPGIGATIGFVLVSAGMAESALWFAGGGILERHPDLRVVFTECSAGWFAWAMQFFDYHYFGRFGNEFLTDMGMPSMQHCEFPPSYYLKRQTACTFMDDPVAVHNRNFTGVESLMWGNDWPHTEGSHPGSVEAVAKQFDGVPEAELRAITHDNAARVFRLTV
jgi:predicted TIM-barrel fold metal-dependent hydrolase